MRKIDHLLHVCIVGAVLYGGIFLFRYLINKDAYSNICSLLEN